MSFLKVILSRCNVDLDELIELPTLNFLYPTRNWINSVTNEVVRLHLLKGSWGVTVANRVGYINGERIYNLWDIATLAGRLVNLVYTPDRILGNSLSNPRKGQLQVHAPGNYTRWQSEKGTLVYTLATQEFTLTVSGKVKIYPVKENYEELMITLLTQL